jgi:ribosomal protein S18 acetylase RimI-like enzyme
MSETNKPLLMRRAKQEDLPAIVRMLADDQLGMNRERYENPLPKSYLAAFNAIDADANNELVVACMKDEVVGVLQLTFIPYLSYEGSWRALIENVRVDARYRSRGFGTELLEWAIARARKRHCRFVQLTTNKVRSRAKQFYESLGFVASHEGMKLQLISD